MYVVVFKNVIKDYLQVAVCTAGVHYDNLLEGLFSSPNISELISFEIQIFLF